MINNIYLIILILICPLLVKSAKFVDSINYFELGINVLAKLEPECYPELEETFTERTKNEKDRRYPWLIDSMGKGINDIGDEIECLYSLQNTTFFLINFYNLDFSKLLNNDQKLIDFLDIKNFTLGFCIMYSCRDAFRRYLELIAELINFIATNKTNSRNLVNFYEDSRINTSESWNEFNEDKLTTKSVKLGLLYIILSFFTIKIFGGIFRTFSLPKGYDKYIAEKLNKLNQNKNNKDFDIEEKTNLSNKNKFNESLNEDNDSKDYNPIFDFSEQLPIKIRILRIFDLFNDLHYLSSKRNRYFNETGLEVIVFLRALMIFGIVFSNTFSALIELPSEEIINSSFFKSWLNIFYRISNNSMTCWIFLEGAYTTYKLLSFITSEIFLYYAKEERAKYSLNIKLLIVFAKFIVLLIPKLITFILIFYILYYRIEDYGFASNAKATFRYIIINLFKQNIQCTNIFSLFQNIFTDNIEDVNQCYEFTYFYINMFTCILIYMFITYLFFVIKNKYFEFVILAFGFIDFIVSIPVIKDDKNINTEFIKEYHIIGQTYSNKIFISFIGFYHLGFIVGFLIFNFDNLKSKINRLLYEHNGIVLSKSINANFDKLGTFSSKEPLTDQNDSFSFTYNDRTKTIDSSLISDTSENSPNYYRNFIMPYYPMKYLNKFFYKIFKFPFYVKVLSILGGIVLLFLLDSIILIYLRNESSFGIKLIDPIKGIFKCEKHLYILIFTLITIIMITLPKKGAFRTFMRSRIFISISRIGFLISCVSHAMAYFSFVTFSIKVKLYVPTFAIISFGNFIVFFIICFIFDTVTELPLKMMIKKLMRINRKRESIMI